MSVYLPAHYLDYLMALSDGAYIPSMKACQSAQQKLARSQRQLSRKVKSSNNWSKLLRKSRSCTCILPILEKTTCRNLELHVSVVELSR